MVRLFFKSQQTVLPENSVVAYGRLELTLVANTALYLLLSSLSFVVVFVVDE